VTLQLTAVPGFDGDALRLAQALRGRGYSVAPSPSGTASNSGEPFSALLSGGADLLMASGEAAAVLPEGIVAGAVLRPEEPRDVLVSQSDDVVSLPTLDAGVRVGVSGARRTAFLRVHRPDLEPVAPDNGGGAGRALRSGTVDAAILGAAEARRLSLWDLVAEALEAKSWVPSPGQGTILVLCRAGDDISADAAAAVGNTPARVALRAEAAVRAALGAEMDAPLGVLAQPHGRWVRVWAMAASPDGHQVIRGDVTGSALEPAAAGFDLAEILLQRGVGALLTEASA
jgi:hydroxymethylbilane synthase